MRIKKDHVKRAGWLFLVFLFVGTALGIGLVSFWQNTHQSSDSTASSKPVASPSCQFGAVDGLPALPAPEVYKPSGDVTKLETTDLVPGTGPAAKAGDCLTVKYYGTLATTGQMFDEDFSKTQGLKFQLGLGEVIPGWDQGLIGMKAGGTRRLVIPSELAYGSQGQGPIPANADLVFVVSLATIN